jgi:diguanylate cyclase (GGDEF)-like protein
LERFRVTVSIGVASNADVRPGSLLDHLLDAADQALYTAKRDGRNRVCISTISAQAINE